MTMMIMVMIMVMANDVLEVMCSYKEKKKSFGISQQQESSKGEQNVPSEILPCMCVTDTLLMSFYYCSYSLQNWLSFKLPSLKFFSVGVLTAENAW